MNLSVACVPVPWPKCGSNERSERDDELRYKVDCERGLHAEYAEPADKADTAVSGFSGWRRRASSKKKRLYCIIASVDLMIP